MSVPGGRRSGICFADGSAARMTLRIIGLFLQANRLFQITLFTDVYIELLNNYKTSQKSHCSVALAF
jgi:prepilin-type processing-associated H-X9-DG protein